MAVCHPAHAGAQGFEAHEPKRGFHAKFFVEGLLRIADQDEWNILPTTRWAAVVLRHCFRPLPQRRAFVVSLGPCSTISDDPRTPRVCLLVRSVSSDVLAER